MILLRATNESVGAEDCTEVSFAGEDEETLAQILAATLVRLSWTVELAQDGEDFSVLGEKEE